MAYKKRILVVDDEPEVTRVIVQFLENTGLYEVMAVNDPREALGVAREFHPSWCSTS